MVAEQTRERVAVSPSRMTVGATRPGGVARARSRRRARRRCGPMTAAVLAATILVSLLCVYVQAYARLTAEGFALSRLKGALREAEVEEESLRAEISRLSLPSAVEHRAQALGMTPAPSEAAQVLAAAPVTSPASDAGTRPVTPAPEHRARFVAQRSDD